jgi:hypothetical protein
VSGSRSSVELAIVLQDNLLANLTTRVVAPLAKVQGQIEVNRTTPILEYDGNRYMIAVHLLSAVPSRNLIEVVMQAQHLEREIKNAIDMVFFGV